MKLSFIRRNAHAVAASLLLTAFTGTALASTSKSPIAQTRRSPVLAEDKACPHRNDAERSGQETGTKDTSEPCDHTAQSGCCKDKSASPSFVLPAGHPPVAGYTVASEPAAKK
ncbi:MAG: hypothetical protein U1G07_06615 [Verrucomicrobiota bacterium]